MSVWASTACTALHWLRWYYARGWLILYRPQPWVRRCEPSIPPPFIINTGMGHQFVHYFHRFTSWWSVSATLTEIENSTATQFRIHIQRCVHILNELVSYTETPFSSIPLRPFRYYGIKYIDVYNTAAKHMHQTAGASTSFVHTI